MEEEVLVVEGVDGIYNLSEDMYKFSLLLLEGDFPEKEPEEHSGDAICGRAGLPRGALPWRDQGAPTAN